MLQSKAGSWSVLKTGLKPESKAKPELKSSIGPGSQSKIDIRMKIDNVDRSYFRALLPGPEDVCGVVSMATLPRTAEDFVQYTLNTSHRNDCETSWH
ncbi:hypothetical protein EVAR_83984_1 [Eumeta japonica]|uniref:Uncharacterized protein n=1 Tax=Eumeta variegata TaxID=151549 RepID=A0A4C1VR36_EUMVA|nr:hypothetical protein EVAR_83984_1 [Eumeta japonica]